MGSNPHPPGSDSFWYHHRDWTETEQQSEKQQLLKMCLLFFVLLEMCTLNSVHAYPNGSVAAVCDSMIPFHPSYEPKNTTAPYRVTADRRTYRPGDMIRVTLESVNSTEFEGFMLQARTTTGNSVVGYFMPGSTSMKSTISHSAPNKLTRLEVMWVAPLTSALDNITFRGTFLKNYAEFWTMVSSPSILLSNSPPPAVNFLMMSFCILITLTALYSNL